MFCVGQSTAEFLSQVPNTGIPQLVLEEPEW